MLIAVALLHDAGQVLGGIIFIVCAIIALSIRDD